MTFAGESVGKRNPELDDILLDWATCWARPEQIMPPGDWNVWLVLAGRGFGKTRVGAEAVRMEVEAGASGRIALVGPTASDVRDTMVEGESGIMACSTPWFRPIYEPSKRRLTWPNGVRATCFSADEPDRLRGPQHDFAWSDEVGAWRYEDAWDQLQFGLRLGRRPRQVVTTTPRPIKIIRDLIASKSTHVTRGNTYANRANLAPDFLKRILAKYEGTRLGRQEIHAEVLDDTPGALWTQALIDKLRKLRAPDMTRIVVAIDPAVTSGEDADETGIVVAGLGVDKHGYVLDDLSDRHSPDSWARKAVEAYKKHKADRIVAEVNNGGDLVEVTIRTVDKNAAYKKVHASKGKATRAEPVAALYEQGRVHHVGSLAKLESQMCTFVPGQTTDASPDRLDACFVAGTLITLQRGDVPIEQVVIGDKALTRFGWRTVLNTGQTSPRSNTRTFITNNGRKLQGTNNHPVWVEGEGFKPIDSLVWGDKLRTCNKSIESCSTELCSQEIPTQKTKRTGVIGPLHEAVDTKIFMSKSGRPRMVQSQRECTSTTKTSTHSTTPSTISNVSRQSNMRQSTQNNIEPHDKKTSTVFDTPRSRGIDRLKVANGTANTAKKPGRGAKRAQSNAPSAGKRKKYSSLAPCSAVASAPARLLTDKGVTLSTLVVPFVDVVSNETSIGPSQKAAHDYVVRNYESGEQPVWNLEVEEHPEYFANGVLVHNCVWAITELMLGPQAQDFKGSKFHAGQREAPSKIE